MDRLLKLVAGTSDLQTFLAELNDMGHLPTWNHTTKPGAVERFEAPTQAGDQIAPPAAGGGTLPEVAGDPLLNRGLEKRSAALTVRGPFQ